MGPTNFNDNPVVLSMLVANGVGFLATMLFGPGMIAGLGLWPLGTEALSAQYVGGVPGFQIWQLVTYGFLHGGLLHLFVNMFALWMFGTSLERFWGSRPFLWFYLVCLVGAGLIQLVVATLAADSGNLYPTIGASGAVFGILLGFAMMFPEQQLMLLFPPIPIKAKYFVLFYGAFELYAGVTGSMSGVAHFAHLGGMAFGFLMITYWRGRLPIKPQRRLMR
ncbi:rhomboid family intramembrane serine protease [Spiribacter roseus]|jgi:membrane associated rhomboid family serine protease|uniref:rhomboid family intramembrane serine protease n=1 Tax=Spiribacter roseus TaxID=1855875 RepID=UPI00132FEF24|nr:rhomboid family intramembrane serine protease [Spiribacter roseus]KAF0283266.1 rhomboid family intramembrane serine protease [Spiribacter roseus]